MPPISFKANYLKTVTIPCLPKPGIEQEKDVSIVELNTSDKIDMRALRTVADLWDNKANTYAYSIYKRADIYNPDADEHRTHYIALTMQNYDYKKLDPKKVLGLVEVEEKDGPENEINYIQVDPSNNSDDSPYSRRCKKVGTTLLDYIKERYSDKQIYVNSSYSAVDFYKKNGFTTKQGCKDSQLIWTS